MLETGVCSHWISAVLVGSGGTIFEIVFIPEDSIGFLSVRVTVFHLVPIG